MTEEWKTISTYPRYQVSNTGRVRNIERKRILHQRTCKAGNPIVQLEHRRIYNVIHLVYAHFVGPRPRGYLLKLKNPRKAASLDNIEAVVNPRLRISPPGRKDRTAMPLGQSKMIALLYSRDGLSVAELAKLFDKSTTTIYYHLRKHGVKMRGERSKGKSYV